MKYRHRLKLYRPTAPASDFAADDATEEFVAEVFASIEAASGTEANQSGQQQAINRVSIDLRWGQTIAAIDSTWWGEWIDTAAGVTRRYGFESVLNKEMRNKELAIIGFEVS